MTDGSDKLDDGFGVDRRLLSPEFAARRRRRAFWAGVLGLAMGFTLLVLGVDSVRTGEWVDFGRVGNTVDLPGVVVVLMALFLLYTSGWVILRAARKS